MLAIISYREADDTRIISGIYENISLDDVINEINENQGTAPAALSREYVEENLILAYIPLVVSGRSYAERKEDLYNKAVEWSTAETAEDWSYGELSIINDFFEINGKRYGLLKEFRENAIC